MRIPRFHALLLALVIVVSGSASAERSSDEKKEPARLEPSHLSALKWRSIGPALTSGRVSDIAVVDSNPDIVYVATATGGVWKTTNRGTTWEPVFENGGTASVGDVTVAPSNPNVVWVGTGEGWPWRSVSFGDGVYKSLDGGKSWQHMGLAESRHVSRIVIHPQDANLLYVAANGALWGANEERGLFKTTDGGQTWSKVLYISKNTGVSDLAMDPRDPEVLYAAAFQRERRNWSFVAGGQEGGLFKTTDGGKTWTQLKNGLPEGEVGRIAVSVCASQPDTVYAAVQAKGKETGIYRSDDRGASWEWRSADVSAKVYCDPNQPERLYVLRNGNNVSEDGGKTLSFNFAARGVHVDHQALWINPANSNHLVLGNDGGLYFSQDRGHNWIFMPHLPVSQFYTVAVDLQEPFYYVYGGTQDNNSFGGPSGTRNTDGITNADWYMTVGGDGFYVQIDPTDATVVYTESQYGRLVRFDTRTGERRLIQPQPPEGEKYRWNWSSPVAISHHDPKTIYFAANKVFKSSNRGDAWKTVSPDLTRQLDQYELPLMGKVWPKDAIQLHQGTADYGNISTFSESKLKAGLLAVGTDDGVISVSRNDGGNWTRIEKFPGVPERTYVSRVAWSALAEGTLYATFDGHKDNNYLPYVYKSTDYGASWTSLVNNLPSFGPVKVILEHPRNPRLLFLGTEFTVFASIDGGAHWISLKNNLPTVPVHDMVVHPRENDLVLGTHGRGFFILDDLAALEELTPERLASPSALFSLRPALQLHRFNRGRGFLGQHHFSAPNPPDGAIITYYVNPAVMAAAKPPEVRLQILDREGKRVRSLEPPQGKEGAGIQRVVWDLRHPLSYKLEPDEETSFFFGAPRGPFVLPGEYQVVLRVGETEQRKTVKVKGDPIIALSEEDRRAWHDLLVALNEMQATVRNTLAVLDQAQAEVKAVREAVRAHTGVPESVMTQIQALADQLNHIKEKMRGESGRSRAEQPGPLPVADQARQLYFSIEGSTAVPTDDQKRLTRWCHEALSEQTAQLNRIVGQELPELRRKLDELGIRWTPGRPIAVSQT
jgi:photosystem II stability/assembly factor-like uncharacterized protein